MSSAVASPDQSIVPHPDVSVLRCRSCSSGYRNVYECSRADGLTRYVAKVKINGRLRSLPGSRSYMPHVSALAVVRWYAETFGDSWREVAKERKALAAVGGGFTRIWYSRARRAFLAAVWIDGRRVEVVPLGPNGKPDPDADEPATFATPEAARAGVRKFVLALTGLPPKRNPRLWRTCPPPVARHPAAGSRPEADTPARPEGCPA